MKALPVDRPYVLPGARQATVEELAREGATGVGHDLAHLLLESGVRVWALVEAEPGAPVRYFAQTWVRALWDTAAYEATGWAKQRTALGAVLTPLREQLVTRVLGHAVADGTPDSTGSLWRFLGKAEQRPELQDAALTLRALGDMGALLEFLDAHARGRL